MKGKTGTSALHLAVAIVVVLVAAVLLSLVSCAPGASNASNQPQSASGSSSSGGQSASSSAPAKPLKKVTAAISIGDPTFFYPLVARAKGYFKDEGLDVEVVYSQGSGSKTAEMLAAKQIQFATGGIENAMKLNTKGKPTVVVFSHMNRLDYATIVVNKELYDSGKIKTLKDLAGKKIGVTGLGGGLHTMGAHIVNQAGIGKAVEFIPLGDSSGVLGGLKSKRVDAIVANESWRQKSEKEGFGKTLFSAADDKTWNEIFGGNIPGITLWVLKDYAAENKDTVEAYVRATAKAMKYIETASPEEIFDATQNESDEIKVSGKEQFVSVTKELKKKVYNYSGMLDKDTYDRGMKVSLGIVGKDVPYEQVVDMSFLKQISGK